LPHAFQGLGEEALRYLAAAKRGMSSTNRELRMSAEVVMSRATTT